MEALHEQMALRQKNTSVKEKVQGSKWLAALQKEKQVKEQHVDEEREARVARLAHLFDESEGSESGEEHVADKLDSFAAREQMNRFMKKVDRHLFVEKALITNWRGHLKK